MPQTFHIISLGCTKNLVDSEKVLTTLQNAGYSFCEDEKKADIIIINTCGFISDAKKESVDEIVKLVKFKKKNKVKIIVFGCLVQRYKEELKKELPEVDWFFGVNAQDEILKVLGPVGCLEKFAGAYCNTPLRSSHIGYLKIAEGCSNRCSYCAIPLIRGDFRSFPKEEIFKDLDALIKSGATEINIIAQDTSLYGKDIYKNYFLENLISDISSHSEIKWIRVLYTHPRHVKKELLKEIAENPKVCKYIDLPLQHISENMLTKMERHVSKSEILNLISDIKKFDIKLRTSFIVGFPGETENDFCELLQFIEQTEFERLGVFKYSREENTRAFDYENQIEDDVISERYNDVMLVQSEISIKKNNALVGLIIDVIIDAPYKKGFIGRASWDAPDVDGTVFITKAKDLKPGDIVKVKIVSATHYDLGAVLYESAK